MKTKERVWRLLRLREYLTKCIRFIPAELEEVRNDARKKRIDLDTFLNLQEDVYHRLKEYNEDLDSTYRLLDYFTTDRFAEIDDAEVEYGAIEGTGILLHKYRFYREIRQEWCEDWIRAAFAKIPDFADPGIETNLFWRFAVKSGLYVSGTYDTPMSHALEKLCRVVTVQDANGNCAYVAFHLKENAQT